MAPRSRRNTTKSGNALDASEVASRLNESQYEGQHLESQENLDEYDMLDIITSIHALEIAAFMKELKNSIPKPNEKASDKDCILREKASQEESAAAHKEGVTTTQLNNTRQKHGEDLVNFVKRFQDLALDCYDEKNNEALVEICINNIVADYRVYLENIGISHLSVKPSLGRSWKTDKNEAHHALVVDDISDYNLRKRKENKSDREHIFLYYVAMRNSKPSSIPCSQIGLSSCPGRTKPFLGKMENIPGTVSTISMWDIPLLYAKLCKKISMQKSTKEH
ncbi:hypothetical protein D8674_026427 [Pyrus ussuriensis x Pyrus communis]|uniref:Uncharacterized protein n=1 Tax=Pyrus ussuriensis x Pyrus communis TaxID=2448454 RepID=A0A5N5I9W7_9ROSA|nr:hypothetical protein D8674_026427 [Pyrus ussuriensis x Pyrus communis]